MSITNGELFSIGLDLCKKESKGRALDPDTWGYYLDWSQRQYFEQEFAKYESTRRVSDTLLPFVIKTTLSYSSKYLPENYKHIISAIVTYSEVDGSYPIDVVTIEEYMDRTGNSLLESTYSDPLMYVYRSVGDDPLIRFRYELDVGDVATPDVISFAYLRNPPACIFDYYIDVEGEIQYLDELESYTLAVDGSEEYRDGSTTGTFVSISKELWWNDSDKLKILEMALMKIGVKMENGAVMQYAGMLNQINQAQP
jgi:hypothetical protein